MRRHRPWIGALLIFSGLFAMILVPNVVRARAGRGDFTPCTGNLKNLATALEMFASDHCGRFPTELRGLTPGYLRTIPTCPAAGRDTYSEGFASARLPRKACTVFCRGRNHAAGGLEENFPQYDSVRGLRER